MSMEAKHESDMENILDLVQSQQKPTEKQLLRLTALIKGTVEGRKMFPTRIVGMIDHSTKDIEDFINALDRTTVSDIISWFETDDDLAIKQIKHLKQFYVTISA